MKVMSWSKIWKGLWAVTLVLSVGLQPLTAQAEDKELREFMNTVRVPLGSPVKVGEWNGDLDACRAKAEKEGIPMIAIWSYEGCAHCHTLERALASDRFQQWAKDCGYILCFTCSYDPKGARSTGAYYSWCGRKGLSGSLSDYPYVRFYWVENGKTKVDYAVVGDVLDKQQGIATFTWEDGTKCRDFCKAGQNCIDYIQQKSGFSAYSPKQSFLGGTFDVPAATNCAVEATLQVEPTTKTLYVPMKREATDAATQKVVAVLEGATLQSATLRLVAPPTITVSWSEGQTNQVIQIDDVDTKLYAEGKTITLMAMNNEDEVMSTASVLCVPQQPNSVANPYWLNEKETLAFGEWTMDLDQAKALAQAEGGYTLIALVGTLWCHDCANTERNFLNIEDGETTKFQAWAAANKVALVAADIPNFSEDGVVTPCLLSRTPFESTLAYESTAYGMFDVSKGGAPQELTKTTLRSGLSYLSRKGVSDAAAAEQLAKFQDLAQKNTAEGGVHRPEDKNAYRPGVPIFVLLRNDGTVAARFTRFASVGPMTVDKANFDNIIKRFDEMLALAGKDASEIENNYPSEASITLKANGGTATNELSMADGVDTFKLDGVDGGVLQSVKVTGESDAEVTVAFVKVGAEGLETIGTPVTGVLSSGVTLENEFAEKGTYYVQVAVADTSAGFFAYDAAESTFATYALSGVTVLVPQEGAATANAPADSDKLTIRVVKDTLYRIQGIEPKGCEGLAAKDPDDQRCQFFTATVDGNCEVTCFYGKGGSVTYQKWLPGKVGFAVESQSAKENDGAVTIALKRVDGKSGVTTVKVSMDEEATNLVDSDGVNRFQAFEPVSLTWEDGDDDEKTVTVTLLYPGARYDGDGKVVLKAELTGDTESQLATASCTLNVSEVDKALPGVIGLVEGGATLVREGVPLEINVSRMEASDGAVSASVKTTKGVLSLTEVAWENHKFDTIPLELTGLKKGETATVTLSAPQGGAKLGENVKLSVTAVAADAIEFKDPNAAEKLACYVAFSNVYELASAPTTKPTFKAISGKLPAGLKVGYDAAKQGMAVYGIPTKAGNYEVVFQVKDGANAGLAQRITFTVTDPTKGTEDAPAPNPAVAGKARSFKDLMVIDTDAKRLKGTLTLTVPSTGKLSAKVLCADGNISLSAKSWCEFDEETGALTAELVAKGGWTMLVEAAADKTITYSLSKDGELVGSGRLNGQVWDKTNPATAWVGYYTVLLQQSGATEETEGVAPRGAAYLTLKMDANAAKTGTMTWAGMLPNGTAVSGKGVLAVEDDAAAMPIFVKKSTTDVFSGVAMIAANAFGNESKRHCVDLCEVAVPEWTHTEKAVPDASYTVAFDLAGAWYDKDKDSLFACCWDGNMGMTRVRPFMVDDVKINDVTIKPASLALVNTSSTTNPNKLTLKFNDSTGVITGTFKSSDGVSCNFAGVLLLGNFVDDGEGGCTICGDGAETLTFQPFAGGSYYYSQKQIFGTKSLTLKKGGNITIEAK